MKLTKIKFLKTGTDKYSMSHDGQFKNIVMGQEELRKYLKKISASDVDTLPKSRRFKTYKSMANGIRTGACQHIYAPVHKLKGIKEESIMDMKEMNPMQGPSRGSSKSNIKIVSYPMDTIKVGDTFTAKRDGQMVFDKGDTIEITGIQPVSIGRGNEFFVKKNGKSLRDPVISDLELVLGESVMEVKEANNVIIGLAKKSGKSEKDVEKLWKDAVKIAAETFGKKEKDFGDKEFKYVTGILKKMLKIKESSNLVYNFLKSDKPAKEFVQETIQGAQPSDSFGIDNTIVNKDKKKKKPEVKVVDPAEKKESKLPEAANARSIQMFADTVKQLSEFNSPEDLAELLVTGIMDGIAESEYGSDDRFLRAFQSHLEDYSI